MPRRCARSGWVRAPPLPRPTCLRPRGAAGRRVRRVPRAGRGRLDAAAARGVPAGPRLLLRKTGEPRISVPLIYYTIGIIFAACAACRVTAGPLLRYCCFCARITQPFPRYSVAGVRRAGRGVRLPALPPPPRRLPPARVRGFCRRARPRLREVRRGW